MTLIDGFSNEELFEKKHFPYELYIQKYKVMALLSKNPGNYVDFLKGYGLVQTDTLFTAWQTFTKETPGEARRENINGIDVYDVYERLTEIGLYDAKIVED